MGTINGEILIYKGSLSSPWLKNSKPLGSVKSTCIYSIRKYLDLFFKDNLYGLG